MNLVVSLTLCFSFFSIANPLGAVEVTDEWTGVYFSKGQKLRAEVRKLLTREGDLLGQAEYTYSAHIVHKADPGFVFDVDLDTLPNGSVVGRGHLECDDPGCSEYWYAIELSKKSAAARPRFSLSYEYFTHQDGDDIGYSEGEDSTFGYRAYQGIEQNSDEPLRSKKLVELVYEQVKLRTPWVVSNGSYKFAGSKAMLNPTVYKKVLLNGKVEALYVNSKSRYESKNGRHPTNCATLLVKKNRLWKAVRTSCQSRQNKLRLDW